MLVTIDRDGSLEHQAAMMLQLLEYLLEKKPVMVRIFDTSRKTEKYECFILYDDLLAQPPLSNADLTALDDKIPLAKNPPFQVVQDV